MLRFQAGLRPFDLFWILAALFGMSWQSSKLSLRFSAARGLSFLLPCALMGKTTRQWSDGAGSSRATVVRRHATSVAAGIIKRRPASSGSAQAASPMVLGVSRRRKNVFKLRPSTLRRLRQQQQQQLQREAVLPPLVAQVKNCGGSGCGE